LRSRATAVIFRDKKVLLVRDKGKEKFSLPGGAIKASEPTVSAAAREVFEELGLHITKVTRLHDCDFRGSVNEHKVCLLEVNGEPYLKGHELDKFMWWDTKEPIPIYGHVISILEKVKSQEKA